MKLEEHLVKVPTPVVLKVIDKADRNLMHLCLKYLWNKAWTEGIFPEVWKQENRVVIPKPGKDSYNDCNSYRTVSFTSVLGKRFEHITSQTH